MCTEALRALHVEAVRYHRKFLHELVDEHPSLDLCRGIPRLLDVEGCEYAYDRAEMLRSSSERATSTRPSSASLCAARTATDPSSILDANADR
jgi:hypothetical protein